MKRVYEHKLFAFCNSLNNKVARNSLSKTFCSQLFHFLRKFTVTRSVQDSLIMSFENKAIQLLSRGMKNNAR